MRVLVLVWGRQVETLQASPLIRTLRAGIPEATISVACSPAAAVMARALEGVGEVLPTPGLDPRGSPLGLLPAWARIRRRRFEVAVVCGTAPQARLLAYFAGIARRVGVGGGLTSLLLSEHLRERRGENRATAWLRLARLLGIAAERHQPHLDPGAAASQRALVQLHSTGIADGRLLVALAPGAGHSDLGPPTSAEATWKPERWAHLANQLAARHGAGVIFVGEGADEAAVTAASVDVAAPHADATGQLDMLGTAALFHLCDLLISGDSPLLHISAAVGTPTIGLFGPTDGRRRGAYGEEHRVVQALPAPGDRAHVRGRGPLMERIRVEDVLAGIESSL